MNETLGEKIKVLRSELKISQEALARNVQCTQSEISRIENNKIQPSYKILSEISTVLGVDTNHFLENMENRGDYLKEVKHQLAQARRERDYNLINSIIKVEEKGPVFQKGTLKKYLLWHKGIVEYHIYKDSISAIHILQSALSHQNISKLYTELDVHILNSLGIICRNNKQKEKAKMYLERANHIIDKFSNIRDTRLIKKVLYNLSKVYTDIAELSESIKLCNKGIKLCTAAEDMFLFAEYYYQKGRNLIILGSDVEGRFFWEKSKEILLLQEKYNLADIIEKEIKHFIYHNEVE